MFGVEVSEGIADLRQLGVAPLPLPERLVKFGAETVVVVVELLELGVECPAVSLELVAVEPEAFELGDDEVAVLGEGLVLGDQAGGLCGVEVAEGIADLRQLGVAPLPLPERLVKFARRRSWSARSCSSREWTPRGESRARRGGDRGRPGRSAAPVRGPGVRR